MYSKVDANTYVPPEQFYSGFMIPGLSDFQSTKLIVVTKKAMYNVRIYSNQFWCDELKVDQGNYDQCGIWVQDRPRGALTVEEDGSLSWLSMGSH